MRRIILSFVIISMFVQFFYVPVYATEINGTKSIKISYDDKKDVIMKYRIGSNYEDTIWIILADKKGNPISVYEESVYLGYFPLSDYEVRDINNDGIKDFFTNITYEAATGGGAVGSIFLTVVNNKWVKAEYPNGDSRPFRRVNNNGIVENALGGSRASTMSFNMEVMGIEDNPNYDLLTEAPELFDYLYFQSRMTSDFKMEYIPEFFANYEVKNMEYNPIYIKGVPFVAIADLKKHMGFDTRWNNKTKSINLTKNGINIELKQSDIYISNNRSYINPEKIAKKFGYRYYYDAYYKVFTLDNKFLFGY